MIGDRIKMFRKNKGFSQEEMADKMCISQSQYSRIERKSENLTISYLEHAARIFEIDVTQLLNANTQITSPSLIASSEAHVTKSKNALLIELEIIKQKERDILKELIRHHNY